VGDGEFFAWRLIAIFFVVVGVWLLVRPRHRKNGLVRRMSDSRIRVPRETLWTRTIRYHSREAE
jgi:hypothetical protein